MSWIRLGLAAVAFASIASVASAQGGPPQGGPQAGRGGGMSRMLFVGINLTDAQKDQVQKINDKYRAERQALMPAGGMQAGPPNDATRAKMMELSTKSQAEYRVILTADQQNIFDKNVADMKARMEQRQKQGAGA
ncbi:MAG TPA: Spy/CpxP family protein refolding chaperone [Gemmatimonadaceae bacterium]|jgi:Spy/CpxP family protein refolding chaperone